MPAAGRKAVDQPAARLSWQNVMAWRLRRQHLDRRVPRDTMLEVIAVIGGLHAQLMSSAELTLWTRVEGLEPEAVQRALWEERSLIKTWAMRGTLHLLRGSRIPAVAGCVEHVPALPQAQLAARLRCHP